MNVYLITGASSDIGCGFIYSLEERKENCTVIGVYNTVNVADKIGKALEFVNLIPVKCDLSDICQVKGLIDYLSKTELNVTHILHLAAPKLNYKKIKDYNSQAVLDSFNIQVNSIGEISRVILPKMKKQGFGKIVFMLSACTLGVPHKYLAEYTVTKYALLGFMKSLVAEYAGSGININAISPNMVETQFLSGIDERIVEMTANSCSMKRNVKIEEIVAAIEYLMSAKADYINGVNLNMTGADRV